MSDVFRSRWTACDDCGCSVAVERDSTDGVPDEQDWHERPNCPVCGGHLGSNWNADEQTIRESSLRQGEQHVRAFTKLYGRQREILDNVAQMFQDWHGIISVQQFLDAFDGGNEDLIPDALAPLAEEES